MLRIGALGILLLTWLVGASALAQVPAACTVTATSAKQFTDGMTLGKLRVQSAWGARRVARNCDNVDLLANAVGTLLSGEMTRLRGQAPSVDAACRLTGWMQGAQDELDAILATCADACFLDGTFWGEAAAAAYCELSILLGGLELGDLLFRGPVQVCGVAFEVGCDSNYLTAAQSFRNAAGERCTEYTLPPFLEVFLETQNNECAYNPLPDDPNP
jgi:hypothetical protein